MTTHSCHCEERAKRRTRQSIVSRGTQTGLSLRSLAHSGSPRAFSPRDDKVWGNGSVRFGYNTIFVIARKERERQTRQSIVSRGTQTGLSPRLLAHSVSPRAFSPRDDKSEGGV
ncbi:MAG: hypothetical protein ACJZ72_00825 [Opitutales bacterium]